MNGRKYGYCCNGKLVKGLECCKVLFKTCWNLLLLYSKLYLYETHLVVAGTQYALQVSNVSNGFLHKVKLQKHK